MDTGSAATPGVAGEASSRERGLAAAARGDWLTLLAPAVLLVLLRVPSLFEPHWYTDEAGYANTAWQMAHGKVLYLTTWNNKPPLLFWFYQLGIGISGPNELGIHLLSVVTELIALGGIWVLLARSHLSRRRTWVAMVLAAVLLATPALNGDLALPENFLVGFTPWAMVALLASLRARPRQRAALLAIGAGVLFALAILIQQTALADLAAGLLLLLVMRRDGWKLAVLTGLAAAALTLLVLAPFIAAAGLHNVARFLVTSYGSYTSSTLHPSLVSLLPRLIAGVLLVVGAWTARHWTAERLLPWLWLPALLIAYGLPNRAYVHFLLPAVPAGVLLLARLRLPHWHGWAAWRSWVGLPTLASTLLAVGLWGAVMGAGAPRGSFFSVKLSTKYYPIFVGRLTGAISAANFVSVYSHTAVPEYQASVWIHQHGLNGATAVVWSPNSWLYLLARLEPILPEPTIYENSALLGNSTLIARVRRRRPVVIFLTSNSYTEYGQIMPVLRAEYVEVDSWSNAELWIRADVAARVEVEAGAAAEAARVSG